MSHPDVRLPVRALVAFSVDPDGRQAAWEPVVAAFRERHWRPSPPTQKRCPQFASTGVRVSRRRPQDARWTRIHGSKSSRSGLRHCAYPLNLDQWIALLPVRPNRRDQRRESVQPRDRRHRLDRGTAHTASLHIAGHGDQERAEYVRVTVFEPEPNRAVDPCRQILDRPLPPQRNRVGASKDLALVRGSDRTGTRPVLPPAAASTG